MIEKKEIRKEGYATEYYIIPRYRIAVPVCKGAFDAINEYLAYKRNFTMHATLESLPKVTINQLREHFHEYSLIPVSRCIVRSISHTYYKQESNHPDITLRNIRKTKPQKRKLV